MKTYGLYEIWLLGIFASCGQTVCAGKKIQKISAGGKKLCICTKYNLKKAVDGHVMEYPLEGSPFLFRSRGIKLDIYLPEQILPEDEVVDYAVLHESMHQRHGDIWWSYLRKFSCCALLGFIHWSGWQQGCHGKIVNSHVMRLWRHIIGEAENCIWQKVCCLSRLCSIKRAFFSVATNMQGSKSHWKNESAVYAVNKERANVSLHWYLFLQSHFVDAA